MVIDLNKMVSVVRTIAMILIVGITLSYFFIDVKISQRELFSFILLTSPIILISFWKDDKDTKTVNDKPIISAREIACFVGVFLAGVAIGNLFGNLVNLF